MVSLFYIYPVIEFFILILIFIGMSKTNKEEWKYTKPFKHCLIGIITGSVLGAPCYFIWGISGLMLGISFGMFAGALAFIIAAVIFNKFIL